MDFILIMFAKLHIPLGLIAVSLLLAAAPTAQANLSTSLLKRIYAQSSEGDAGDIYRLIKRALDDHQEESDNFVKKIIGQLEDNLGNLDNGVSKDDLQRVSKRLRKYLKQRRAAQLASLGQVGNITPPESGSANN